MKVNNESTATFEARMAVRAGLRPTVLNPLPGKSNLSLDEALARANAGAANGHASAEIALELMDTDPQYQTRLSLDEEHIEELRKAFLAVGMKEPIRLRKKGDRYVVLRGHHRREAAVRAGWSHAPAIVIDVDDREALLDALISNGGRLDETDFEKSLAYQRAVDLGFAKSQTEISVLFGITQARVSQVMEFQKLPPEIISLLRERPNLITYRVARHIRELCEKHPAHINVITEGMMRIVEGAEEGSVRAWVLQTIQKLTSPARPTLVPREIMTPAGRSFCSVRTSGQKITIDAKGVKAEVLEQAIFETLRRLSQNTGADQSS